MQTKPNFYVGDIVRFIDIPEMMHAHRRRARFENGQWCGSTDTLKVSSADLGMILDFPVGYQNFWAIVLVCETPIWVRVYELTVPTSECSAGK